MKMIYIQPVACPRPRFNRKTGGVYYPKTYTKFRSEFKAILESLHYKKIENKGDLEPLSLYAIFAFNSSKNGPCPSNADLDNLLKALCDTLQDYGAIVDDKQIVSITARKEYTKEPSHIAFKLEKLNSIYY
tara:strand:+ start:1604 stop:1996 length:393 start_codon:yes stop_codon:yes gene_type:complete